MKIHQGRTENRLLFINQIRKLIRAILLNLHLKWELITRTKRKVKQACNKIDINAFAMMKRSLAS